MSGRSLIQGTDHQNRKCLFVNSFRFGTVNAADLLFTHNSSLSLD
jgi:hypothetical protein